MFLNTAGKNHQAAANKPRGGTETLGELDNCQLGPKTILAEA
jgi:hypothetical protein